ncbi:hypothetical protein [Microbispora sp. GKU 823]|uniref:hypothetical protein n=1 Tax=Microbispora sp. GKU 823 TaxID=1652100 RepID=UPI001C4DF135|nr:hypothetical protein [Microbispora sp. GKU 823]
MDAGLFLADLEAKPEALEALAGLLDGGDPFEGLANRLKEGRFDRVVFLGMLQFHRACG